MAISFGFLQTLGDIVQCVASLDVPLNNLPNYI